MKDYPDYAVALGKVVREARTNINMSQDELANTIQVANRTILNIENGRGNPKLDTLYSLLRTLKIDSRLVFNPEMINESPELYHLRILLEDCTDEEIQTMIPVIESVLKALRAKDAE